MFSLANDFRCDYTGSSIGSFAVHGHITYHIYQQWHEAVYFHD